MYELAPTEAFKRDVEELPKPIRHRVRAIVTERLTAAPDKYGTPLRGSLSGYWKIRTGDYRIVFKIRGRLIILIAVKHRKLIYG